MEKDLVIGELTTRMKGRLPKVNKAGFNKNRRGEYRMKKVLILSHT